jgi:hypothetical protein
MTAFYDASHPQASPLPDGSVDLSPKPSKTYEIRHCDDGARVFVRDRHGFEQLYTPRPQIKRLDTAAPALGLVSISTSDTPNAAKALLEEKGIIILPAVEVMRLKKLQKHVRTVTQVITEELQRNHVRYKAAMVTLTYRPDVIFQPRQVTEYVKCVKEWAKRRGFVAHYVWVMELTKIGRPHYHVVWFLPKGMTMPKADKQGWWKYGMTNTVFARSPVGYLCKYTSKGIDPKSWGLLPKGARLHGSGGVTKDMRFTKNWHLSPLWVRQSVPFSDRVKKIGAYWVNMTTGMGQSSPWLYCWRSRVIKFVGFGDLVHVDDFRISEDKSSLWIPKDVMNVMAKAAMTAMDIHFEAIDRAFDEFI